MSLPNSCAYFILIFCFGTFSHGFSQSLIKEWQKNQDLIENLEQRNQLKQAKPLIIYNLNLAEDNFGGRSKEYRYSIFYLARLYQAEKNYKSAEQTYKKLQELFMLLKEHKSLEYGILLKEMAIFYSETNRIELADSIFFDARFLLEELGLKKSSEYASILINQAKHYHLAGDFDLAVELYGTLDRKYKKHLPPFEYMTVLLDLGAVYESVGRYKDALKCYEKCINIRRKKQKDLNQSINKDGMMALAIAGQARALEQLGEFKQAKTAFTAVYSLYSIKLDKGRKEDREVHQYNFRCFLDEYASFYEHIGDYDEAIKIFAKIDSLGGSLTQIAMSACNKAILYEAMGKYPLAEQYYLKAIEILKSLPQENEVSRSYANALLNLAGLYELIGRYKSSEKLYLKAKEIDEMTIGREHTDYAATLNNFAKLYVSQQQYQQAEKYYNLAQHILENKLHKFHPQYIQVLSNKAFLYKLQNKYELAEELYLDVLKLQKKVVGAKHPNYAETLSQLAGLYKWQGDYKKSKKLYQKALKIQLELFGEQHPEYAATMNEYAQLHHHLGQATEAWALFKQSNKILVEQLKQIYPILSEHDRLVFFSKQEPYFEAFFSFASDYIGELPDLVYEIQSINLLIKGLALEATIESKGDAVFSGDDELLSLYKKWKSLRKQVSKYYSQHLNGYDIAQEQIDTLINKANELEAEISKRSNKFRAYNHSNQLFQLNFIDLVVNLTEQEAVIDFLCFNYYNGRNYTNEKRYAALLTRQGMPQPQWIYLGTEEELKLLLNRNINQRSSNYTSNKQIGQKLYRQLWLPFEPFLNDVKDIHLSPAGLLHKVSFAALPTDSLFLLHRYGLSYHSNLREFISSRKSEVPSSKKSHRIFMLGDPAFSKHPSLLPKTTPAAKASEVSVQIFGDQLDGHFYRLEGTEREIKSIRNLFDSVGWQTQVFLDQTATEESIKQLQEKPQVLHLATHGYFFAMAQKEDSVFLQQSSFQKKMRYAVNPLLRSGLAFAGANYIWRGRRIPANREDGILMAYEVANLDLFGVELVTLSACDTGRGDIHNSEGVLGLQRAFKAAGAQHLILSLWRVPDQETAELMGIFYQKHLEGLDWSEAFRQAQIELSKIYPPFYWAGFIFVN